MIEESKANGVLETARKHGLNYRTLKNWCEAFALHGADGLDKKAVRPDPELKRLYQENERLKLILADKELEIRVKDDLLKKTSLRTTTKK